MKKIAVTGNIGSGKSTLCAFFKAQGYPLFDADQEIQTLYQTSEALKVALSDINPSFIQENQINKKAIMTAIHQNPPFLSILEAILYPLLEYKKQAFIKEHKAFPIGIFEIPLLFEHKIHPSYDTILLPYADKDTRWNRVKNRPHMTKEKFDLLQKKQIPYHQISSQLCIKIDMNFPPSLSFLENMLLHIK